MTKTEPTDDALLAIDAAAADVGVKRRALAALEQRARDLNEQLATIQATAAAAAVDMAQGSEGGRDAFDVAGREVIALQATRSALVEKLIPDASIALEQACIIEATVCRQAAYDEAARQSAEAQTRLLNDYPEICARFVDLLTAVTLAAASVEAANRDRPPGAARLLDPEAAVRDLHASTRRVVAEEEVLRWVICGSGRILSEAEAAEKVHSREDARSGYMAQPGRLAASPATQEVELRPCVLTVYEPERPGSTGERLATVNLPGLKAGDSPFWLVPRSVWADANWQPPLSTVLDNLFSEASPEADLPRTRSEIRLK